MTKTTARPSCCQAKAPKGRAGQVLEALRSAGRPVGAYEVMDRLRDQGVSAPPTVYRALNALVRDGLAHRIEKLNAFVACTHTHGNATAFIAICDECGQATEFEDEPLARAIEDRAQRADFAISGRVIELHGRCAACAPEATA